MGVIVPEDLRLASLGDEAERRVVAALRDGLGDSWLILPDVRFRGDSQDHQLDVVLIHPDLGVLVLEVKGHRVTIEGGRWRDGRGELERQPPAQARNNAYALRDLLRRRFPQLRRLHVNHAIALPNTTQLSSSPGPDLLPEQVLTAEDLEDPSRGLEVVASGGWSHIRLDDGLIGEIVSHLLPDVRFEFDPTARQRRARAVLDELCSGHVRALESLDENRRVVVRGAAGTGKSLLASHWARRALVRGERVLLTCYNEPLAGHLADRTIAHEALTVAPFLRWALDRPELPPLEIPEDADHDWWTITAVGHLAAHWHLVDERFDTIVVDEAQDFSPTWLALLETVLAEDGPRRMLLVADPAQVLYQRGFSVPRADDGWVQGELAVNYRNAHQIAGLLRRRFHGAAAPPASPEAVDVRFVELPVGPAGVEVPSGETSEPDDAVVSTVRAVLDELVLAERNTEQIMVLTFSSRLRDLLGSELDLRPWEHRGLGIVGQTVHRAKGLEADTVVLVTDREDEPADLVYVGISRAVSELVVIGPATFAERIGLEPTR